MEGETKLAYSSIKSRVRKWELEQGLEQDYALENHGEHPACISMLLFAILALSVLSLACLWIRHHPCCSSSYKRSCVGISIFH